MGLGELVAEIAASGEAEAREIRTKAQREAEAIQAQARAEADAVLAKWTARAKEEGEALSRRVLASAELEAKKLRLAAESDALQAVRAAAVARLTQLGPQERAGLTRALVKASGVRPGGRAWARADDRDLVKELGFEYAGELKGLGGVVVEDPSGETREDLRFESVLDEAWRSVVREVANDLFGK